MDVPDFFDAKAERWATKYAARGPLTGRLAAFAECLTRYQPPPARVLDFGCGTGNLSRHLAGHGFTVVACDISASMIAEARRQDGAGATEWTVLGAEGAALPYRDGTLDGVVASSVLEYVPEVEGILGELARVLRRDGVLVVSVPNPHHPVRRIEALLARAARSGAVRALALSSRRASSYLEYLRLSRNRFEVEGWVSVAASSGLRHVETAAGPRGPLMMLCFRREPF